MKITPPEIRASRGQEPTVGMVQHVMRNLRKGNPPFYDQNNELLLPHAIAVMDMQLYFDSPLFDKKFKNKLINDVKHRLGWE
tara:strand:+ start:602 stop:847 length:246 start_codon:yes stop_codon:yes gene_type:complete